MKNSFWRESMKKITLFFLLFSAMLFAERPFDYPPQQESLKPNFILGIGEHFTLGMSPDGVIELENECQFKTPEGYAYALQYWDLNDHVTFTPNNHFFGGSEFYLVNLTKNESLKANIWRGPNLDNPCTSRLLKVDELQEEVVLSNSDGVKSRWKIQSEDFPKILEHWKLGASVIAGKNAGSCLSRWFSSETHILVCYRAARHNLYVRATPIPL